MSDQTEPATEPETPQPPPKKAAKRRRTPRTPETQAPPGVVRNDADVPMYFSTIGKWLEPGESLTPTKPEE